MLPWPLPALLVWAAAWGACVGMVALGVSPVLALGLPSFGGVAASLLGHTWWRRLIIGAGFPLSLALSGLLRVPGWGWLLPLALLLLIYPINAWRDAPIFPTPKDALNTLPDYAPLPPGAPVLDAGCGAGQGMQALRQAYPLAHLHGIEWSWPLRIWCAWVCPWAQVRQGDIWLADWSGYALVYLFQRPESMPRALEKARAEMPAGAWLVSLEFEMPGAQAVAQIPAPGGRIVWVYQAPFTTASSTFTPQAPGDSR